MARSLHSFYIIMTHTITAAERGGTEEIAAQFLPAGWKFRWARAGELGRDLGICYYTSKTIVLKAQRQPVGIILMTLAHEIAHALTPGHAHDITWWSTANDLDQPVISAMSAYQGG